MESPESPNELYCRLLLTKNRKGGYPLWIPEPNKVLPKAYYERGVSIGDVGLITEDGQFDYLFNICEDENHPVNGGPIPAGDGYGSGGDVNEQLDATSVDDHVGNDFRTPAGFRPVVLNPAIDLQEVEVIYPPGSDISSTSMKRKHIETDAQAGEEGSQ